MRVRRKMEGAMWSEEGELKSSEASRVREACDAHGAKTLKMTTRAAAARGLFYMREAHATNKKSSAP